MNFESDGSPPLTPPTTPGPIGPFVMPPMKFASALFWAYVVRTLYNSAIVFAVTLPISVGLFVGIPGLKNLGVVASIAVILLSIACMLALAPHFLMLQLRKKLVASDGMRCLKCGGVVVDEPDWKPCPTCSRYILRSECRRRWYKLDHRWFTPYTMR